MRSLHLSGYVECCGDVAPTNAQFSETIRRSVMRFVPHLIFDGQCETAFRFYERTLDGNLVTLLTYGGSAMAEQLPREWREKIVHANLTVDDTELVGADAFPGQYNAHRASMSCWNCLDPSGRNKYFQLWRRMSSCSCPGFVGDSWASLLREYHLVQEAKRGELFCLGSWVSSPPLELCSSRFRCWM